MARLALPALGCFTRMVPIAQDSTAVLGWTIQESYLPTLFSGLWNKTPSVVFSF